MQKSTLSNLLSTFESHRYETDGVEFWYARELQWLLGYEKWSTFESVMEKAMLACRNSKQKPQNHFPDAGKMVTIWSGAERLKNDYRLTRYACYLIAQNGDSRKEQIAFAMSYFAFQTRKQEILETRIAEIERILDREKLTNTEKEFSRLIYETGIDSAGFARIRSSGDTAFFWGKSTKEMKHKLKVPDGRVLADFLPSITIKAKDFATDCADTETLFRIIQSIPSPKAEPFKIWLAKVGYERKHRTKHRNRGAFPSAGERKEKTEINRQNRKN